MPLKIAVLGSRGIPAKYGGFETFCEFLSVGLASEGHDVTVYCPDYQEYAEPTYKGVHLRRITNQERRFKHRVLRAACNIIYDAKSFIAASRSDVDVIYMLGYASGPFLLIPKLFGKKLAVNPDGLEWKSTRWGLGARAWLFFCEYLSAKIPDVLITDAEPIALHFQRRYGRNSACIPYGTEIFDQSTAVDTGYPPGSYYLSVARMVPETKIDEMIEGYKRSGSSKDYVIVGPVADAKFFEREVSPRVGGKVKYLGAIYDKPFLNSLRAGAAALLHGHASDGTNPSLLESMGCASPVIAIRRPSNAAVITEENGMYFDDAEELAEKIREFEELPQDRRFLMGQKNALRARERFSWAVSVRAHVNAFAAVMDQPPAEPARN